MTDNVSVKTEIEGIVKNFKEVDKRYFSDGGLEIDVEMNLDGPVSKALIGPADGAAGKKTAPPGTPVPGSMQAKASVDGAGQESGENAVADSAGRKEPLFSGIVVDVRGLTMVPALSPRVLTAAYTSPDRAAAKRAFDAMMGMRKIDIATIEAALRG